jgi:hypothetical protein
MLETTPLGTGMTVVLVATGLPATPGTLSTPMPTTPAVSAAMAVLETEMTLAAIAVNVSYFSRQPYQY